MTVEYLVLPYVDGLPDFDQEMTGHSLGNARRIAKTLAVECEYDNVCIYEDKYDENGELVVTKCVDKVWKEG